MIDPTGLTTYTYDALNRLTSIINNRGLITSLTYDALGRRTSMTHGNGVTTNYQYDPASQLTRLVHQLGAATINSFDYTYDRVGNRKTKTDSNGTASYTYDTLNRLIEAINPIPTNPLESFTYDAVGNRTTSNQNGASVFNQANQLEEDATFRYVYDANGNLIRKTSKADGAFTTFEYTAENQLVRVVKNGTVINCRFDGLGSITEITDSVGLLKQQYTYSSFGKIESQLDPNFIQPYTFTAREFDPETNLYFLTTSVR